MANDEHRRKPFGQCSSRHQRRIIQEDIKTLYQDVRYRQLDDNTLEAYNDKSNVDTFTHCHYEAERVSITNDESQTENVEEDCHEYYEMSLDVIEDHESNAQLSDFVSNDVQEDNTEYWKEFMNDDYENINYILSDDDLDINDVSNANTESGKESENFQSDLCNWALHNNISQKAINELLKLLQKNIPNCSLPTDARTLLCTPRTINCLNIADGEYLHFGLVNVMNFLMEKYINAKLVVDNINLSLNVDGLPISKSSSHCFWPILVSDEIFKSVHIIGIYYGRGKPTSANNFLQPFINEIKIFIQDGFIYNGRRISVNLSTIICDAPAKSFILYTKGHNGFSSCPKCIIVGETVQRTVCFPYSKTHYNLRTDTDFSQQTDEEYHQGETALLQISNIGLVSAVALDYMHLICLGVVKKLLLLWMKGPLTIRIGSTKTNLISQRLISLKNSIPREFSRKPRSLSEIKYWKATEFRQFLLYTGPIVLKSILQPEIYEHFLTLHVAITILITPTLIANNENINYAEGLLTYFVEGFQMLYGKQFISHNVHNLLHLCNEVRRNGVLDNFSAFRFENFLGSLKKLIRKPEKPLQQLARRYSERQHAMFQEQVVVPTYQLNHEHPYGPLLYFPNNTITQYKVLQTNVYYFNCDDANNNVAMLDNKIIIRILNIVSTQTNDIYIIGRKFNIINHLYETPCLSTMLSIFRVVEDNILFHWPVKQIMCKMWAIKTTKTECIVIPLRHNNN